MAVSRYYFKKPRSEIVKDILFWVAIGALVSTASPSPALLYRAFQKENRKKKYRKQSIYNAFYRLRKEGVLSFSKRNNQLYVSLTEKGRKKAGKFQLNHLQIKRPKKWDGKWRVLFFDVEEHHRVKREALRGFLKRLGFRKLQQSVWVHPFDCRDEVDLLREFFGFAPQELQLITTENLENEISLKKEFRL